jgi:hypothetical protein
MYLSLQNTKNYFHSVFKNYFYSIKLYMFILTNDLRFHLKIDVLKNGNN